MNLHIHLNFELVLYNTVVLIMVVWAFLSNNIAQKTASTFLYNSLVLLVVLVRHSQAHKCLQSN